MNHKKKHRVIEATLNLNLKLPTKIFIKKKQKVQNDILKMIVKLWEELHFNKSWHGMGYEKGINFHIPYYSKPFQFVSAWFLYEKLNSLELNAHENSICMRCINTGHPFTIIMSKTYIKGDIL